MRLKWLKRKSGIVDALRTQSDFCFAPNGDCLLTFIGRFESIQADFDIVCATTGLSHKNLPRENASSHRYYRDYYSPLSCGLVREMYEEDIERFGFTF